METRAARHVWPRCVLRAATLAMLSVTLVPSRHLAHAVQLQPGDIVVVGTIPETSSIGLLRVDPVTGDRSIISDNTHGAGLPIASPQGISLTGDGKILVADSMPPGVAPGRVVLVDPATGDRTVLSSGSGPGTGPSFGTAHGAREVGDHIFVTDGRLVSVDPATGDRTIVSSSTIGSGPTFDTPIGFVASGDHAIVANAGGFILDVNLINGDRTIVSGSGVGSGTTFVSPIDLAMDGAGSLLVTDRVVSAIFRVDALTGGRQIVSSNSVGTGPAYLLAGPLGMALEGGGTAVVTNPSADGILRVNLSTGDRVILSDATHGVGPMIDFPLGILVVANVPEPSTLLLVALGWFALLLTRPFWER